MKQFKFNIGGTNYEASVEEKAGNTVEVTVNGKVYSVELEDKGTTVATAPRPAAQAAAAPAAKPAAAGAKKTIKAPLPGNITKILVSEGQQVKQGDVIMTMEAMKMENNITAEADCTIKKITVTIGQSVTQDNVLAEIETASQAAPAAAPKAAPAPAPKAAPAAAPKAAPAAGGKKVAAPLPGTITKIAVQTGQAVKKGDLLVVMEAMKMENNITSEYDGTVGTIFVQQGSSVMNGDALVEIA